MVNVKGKWALITGASRGVGYGLALFMAGQGCNLILHSRNVTNTDKVLKEVKDLGVKAYAVAAELSEHEAVVKMLEEIDQLDVSVDFVFNNAGVQVGYRTEYYETPVSDFDMSFRINCIAVATICYHFLPKMIDKGFGRIVNTTSGIRNEPEQAGYSAGKAALDKFTTDLASRIEGTNVMMNLTDPGWCRTDLGGPHATNAVEDSLPGVAVGAFLDDQKSGRNLAAGHFIGMTIEEAVAKAETL